MMAMYPTYVRPRQGRVIAGVAAGVANHLNMDVFLVRVVLLLSSLLSGAGALFYAAAWMLSKVEETAPAPVEKVILPRWAYYLLSALAFVAAVAGDSWGVAISLALIAVGAMIAWRAYDKGLQSRASVINATAGAFLVLAGVILTTVGVSNGALVTITLAVLLTVAGVGALIIPLVVRSLAEERAAKERAEIASRLHDSVLQTLAIIQKRADAPDEVARLARTQERELRAWLFEPEASATKTIFATLREAAAEVEDLFGLRIAPVTVGEDVPLTPAAEAAVMASREAMVNAAKHAGVNAVDVYAELLDGKLSIFVRDRGVGFDPQDAAPDRHGIQDSIVGRMQRVGGESEIKSAPGEGAEVMVSVSLW